MSGAEPGWAQRPDAGNIYSLRRPEPVCHRRPVHYESTTIHERDIEARVKAAVIRLRFECPLVTATIEPGIHHPDFGSWVYAPLATADAARAWADQAVHYLPDPVEPSSFLQSTVETNKIPYVLADRSAQYLRFYLTRPSSTLNTYCLLLHTAHCTTDAKPALNALSLLMEWMTAPEPEVELGDLAWGTEHKNLPPGPVTATGGPREDWGTNGMALMQKFQEIFADQTPSHGLEYDASADRAPGKAHRFHIRFMAAQESAKIAQALKSLGFTFSELLDAASIVGGFEQTPVPADKVASAHIKGAYLIALTDCLAPSVDRRKYLVSALAFAPYRVDYAPLAPLAGRARLLAALRQGKDQCDWSLANPCLPLLVATLGPHIVPTTEASTAPAGAYAPMMANVGRVEDYVAPVWPKDQDQDKGGEGEGAAIRVEDMHMACRMSKAWFQPTFHSWSIQGRLSVLLESSYPGQQAIPSRCLAANAGRISPVVRALLYTYHDVLGNLAPLRWQRLPMRMSA